MSYQITRPDADQIKITSAKTGEWVLEDYIQDAEIGNKTLAQLLVQIFDASGVPNATMAADSAAQALSSLNAFKSQYYGSYASDPSQDPLGGFLSLGDLYFNTTDGCVKVYSGSGWINLWNAGLAESGPMAGYRNFVMNGDMRIGQRFGNTTSMNVTPNGTTWVKACDRWEVACTGDGSSNSIAWQNNILSQPFTRSLGVLCSNTQLSYIYFRHRIEGANAAGLVGKTVALSYMAYCTRFNAIGGGSILTSCTISTANAKDDFTSVTNVTPLSGGNTANNGTSWFSSLSTFVMPASAANGLEIVITLRAHPVIAYWTTGHGAHLTQVQLEVGSSKSTFEQRPYGAELELCQRYLPSFYGLMQFLSYASSSTNVFAAVKFPTDARKAPTGVSLPPGAALSNFIANGLTPSAITINSAGNSTALLAATVSGAATGAPGTLQSTSTLAGLLFDGCDL